LDAIALTFAEETQFRGYDASDSPDVIFLPQPESMAYKKFLKIEPEFIQSQEIGGGILFWLAGLLGAVGDAMVGAATVDKITATLVDSGVGTRLGIGVASAIKQHRTYQDVRREREAVLADVKNEGIKTGCS
jgi:hypothetical protein